MERLKSNGLQLHRTEEDLSGYTDKLAGQSIVISGVFTHHSRDEYKEMIEKNGGKNVGSISSKPALSWPEKIWDLPNWRKRRNWE